MKTRLAERICCLALLLIGLQAPRSNGATVPDSGGQPESRRGQKLVEAYCGTCHSVPDPQWLDRKTWLEELLPRMAPGGSVATPLAGPGTKAFTEDTDPIFLARLLASRLDEDSWKEIVDYFATYAPEKLETPIPPRPLRVGLPGFRVEFPEPVEPQLLRATAIRIDSRRSRILTGSTEPNLLVVHDQNLKPIQISNLGMPPTWFEERIPTRGTRQLSITVAGRLDPNDQKEGYVMTVDDPGTGNLYQNPQFLFGPLRRSVHTSWGDLNGDGRLDAVVCQFGWQIGHFTLHVAQPQGGFAERTLIPRPGAIMSRILDYDGDEDLDILVLMTQANEGVYLLENKGGGEFEETLLIGFPPVFGVSSLEPVDMNGDGLLDLVVTSGDNTDYSKVFKPYHGVHVYLNRREAGFERAYFYPLDGAYQVRSADFDLDGDQDLAAVAYFANFEKQPARTFVYFENSGAGSKLDFLPRTIGEAARGRWFTMDVGDVDADGDVDIVLGNFLRPMPGPGEIPAELQRRWARPGPRFLLLRNRLRGRQ